MGKALKIWRIFLLSIAFMLTCAVTVSAYPLTNWDVSATNAQRLDPGLRIGGQTYTNVYTVYGFYADEFGEYLPAFCVEDVLVDPSRTAAYTLADAPDSLGTAALIAHEYFYGNAGGWQQHEAQIAIWNVLFGVAAANSDLQSRVNSIVNYNDFSNISNPLAMAASVGKPESQNFLVAKPVPEPATVLLLGIGLLGILGIGRRRLTRR